MPYGTPLFGATGYYRVLARSLRLYDADGNVIAAVSEHAVLYQMVVLPNGRFYFDYDDIPAIGPFPSTQERRLQCLDALRRTISL